MKRKIIGVIALTLCALMAAMCLTACGGDSDSTADSGSKSALVGTWGANEAEGMSYVFNEDGTGKWDAGDYAMEFTYVDKGSSVELSYKDANTAQTWEYTIKGNTLSMKESDSGVTLTYTKK